MRSISYLIASLFLIDTLLSSTAIQDIRLPPSITEEPVKHTIFRDDATILMTCIATGIPKPEYSWKKNGAPLNLNVQNLHPKDDGTFEINPTTLLDEGFYQCIASNQYGTVMSNTSHLQRAVLSESDKHKMTMNATEGQPFSIPVVLPKCYPPPTFSWEIGKEVDDNPKPLTESKRIQISHNGELHFAYVLPEDASQESFYYKLNVFNSYRDIRAATNYVHLIVTRAQSNFFAPTIGFKTQSPTVAVEGRNLTLRCFFGGRPEPTIAWRKSDGTLPPAGRHKFLHYNTELFIERVEETDAGDYVCSSSSSAGSRDEYIQVNVQVAPTFTDMESKPHDINKTEGEEVIFRCMAQAKPQAKVTWFRNGAPLKPDNLPPNFKLTNNSHVLTISNLCKNCSAGSDNSSLQVIQCNASNEHGYALGTGYVNVLQKTVINNPTAIQVSINNSDGARFEFPCSGYSDDSTPISISWYHYEKNELVRVQVVPEKRIIAENGSLIVHLAANDSEGWGKYQGNYTCIISNTYSKAERNISINVRDYVPPSTDGLVSAGADTWWIFLIIAVILLMIILILCCCVYMQRNRGDSYPVDQKERKNGNDPEKEMLAYCFQDYQRPSDEKLTGSRTLLGSRTKLDIDDDTGSMNEYDQVNTGKFNEDGSFVGQYNTVDRIYTGTMQSDDVK